MTGELFSPEWRADHARRGDVILAELDAGFLRIADSHTAALAAIAAAHYLAANVRAKPNPATTEGKPSGE